MRALLAAYAEESSDSSDSSSTHTSAVSLHYSEISEASIPLAAMPADEVSHVDQNMAAADTLQAAMAISDIKSHCHNQLAPETFEANMTSRPDVFSALDPMIGQLFEWLVPAMPDSANALKQLATHYALLDEQHQRQSQELARLQKASANDNEKIRSLSAYVRGVEDVHHWTVTEILKCTPKCKLLADVDAGKGEKREANEPAPVSSKKQPVATGSTDGSDMPVNDSDARYKGKVVYVTAASGERAAAVMVSRCQAPGCSWFERPLGSVKISTHWRQRHSMLGAFDRCNTSHMIREIMTLSELDSQ